MAKKSIKINFFAEPYNFGSQLELDETLVDTSAGSFTYTPILEVPTPATVGLVPDEIYQVTALLRVWAPNEPALGTGSIEEFLIQTYS